MFMGKFKRELRNKYLFWQEHSDARLEHREKALLEIEKRVDDKLRSVDDKLQILQLLLDKNVVETEKK